MTALLRQNWVFYTFEVVTYLYLLLMARHAWTATRSLPMFVSGTPTVLEGNEQNHKRWLSTLLWGVVFGIVIELVLTSTSTYHYSDDFLVMLPNYFDENKPLPLCVGVGWGVFLYSTTWTSQRMKLAPPIRAVLAGLLAVSIDFALDPAAEIFGFWHWPNIENYPSYHGVPFDNFIGWFLIVTSYSFLVRLLFRALRKARATYLWVPVVAAAGALFIVCVIDEFVLPCIYARLNGDVLPFTVLFFFLLWLVSHHARREIFPTHMQPSWAVLSVPIAYPVMCWLLLVGKGAHHRQEEVELLLAIPMSLLLSFLAFAWGSLDCFFPRKATDTELERAT